MLWFPFIVSLPLWRREKQNLGKFLFAPHSCYKVVQIWERKHLKKRGADRDAFHTGDSVKRSVWERSSHMASLPLLQITGIGGGWERCNVDSTERKPLFSPYFRLFLFCVLKGWYTYIILSPLLPLPSYLLPTISSSISADHKAGQGMVSSGQLYLTIS